MNKRACHAWRVRWRSTKQRAQVAFQGSVSIGSSCGVAEGAPLEVPPPVELPTAGVIATGLVTRLGGDTLVPATEIDSPTATGRTDEPAATGAGADPAAGAAVGVAVAVIAVAVAVVAGIGAPAATPKSDSVFAAGVPGTVMPAGAISTGADVAAGVPTVEVAVEMPLLEVEADAVGETLPPVTSPGPPPAGNVEVGATAALVDVPLTVELVDVVCASAAGAPSRTATHNVAPPMTAASLIPRT